MFERVFGIDPGLTTLGWGVVEAYGSGFRAAGFGAVRTHPDAPLPERLAGLAAALRDLFLVHTPSAVAVERLLHTANSRTAMSVARASGVALLVAGEAGLDAAEYTPTQVKAALAGYGRAGKDEVAQMVRRVLGISGDIQPADAADALAVALCHAQAGSLRRAVTAAIARDTK